LPRDRFSPSSKEVIHGTNQLADLEIQTMLFNGTSDCAAEFPSHLWSNWFFEKDCGLSVLEVRGRNFVDHIFELLRDFLHNMISNAFGGGGVDF